MTSKKQWLPVACWLFVLMTTGCGRQGPELVPVQGSVTFGGGVWPKPGKLSFNVLSDTPGVATRPATAEFDTDGNFTVTTFTKGDGLLPGKYGVAVVCWEVPPQMGSPIAAKSYVPLRYRSAETSGLTVSVESGQKVAVFQLDVPKQ